MRLLRLDIDGFGKLVDQRFDFERGLNLVYGGNEAGKTTLLQAIISLLFGHTDAHRRRAAADLARYRPWSGAPFGGELVFELADGRRYKIRRKFGRRSQVEIQRVDGEPASAQENQAVDQLLGVTAAIFSSSALVNQNAILQLAKPGELSEAILRALDSGEVESSVEAAVSRLQAARQDLGEPTDVETPWGRLEAEIDDLTEQRNHVASQKRELLDYLARRRRLEHRRKEYQNQLAEVELAVAAQRHRMTAERLQRIREAERQLEEHRRELQTCEPFSALPRNGRDHVLQAWQRLEAAQEDLDDLTRERQEIEAQIAAVQDSLNGLRPYAYLCPPGDYDYFAESCAAWLAAHKRLQTFADAAKAYEQRMRQRGLSAEHLQALAQFSEAEFTRLQEKEETFQHWHRRLTGLQEDVLRLRARHPFPRSLKVALGVATIFFSGVNFLIWYLHQVTWGLIVGGTSALTVGLLSTFLAAREAAHRRKLRRLETEMAEVHERAYQLDREVLEGLEAYGAGSLTELLTRRIEYLEAGSLFREVQIAQEDQHRLGGRLQRLLEPLGVHDIDADSLAKVSARVEETRNRREELNALLDRRDQIRRRMLAVELEARRHQTTIRKALEAAGVEDREDLDRRSVLEEVYAKRDRYDHLRREIAGEEKVLAGLLGGRTRQEWEESAAALERQVNRLRSVAHNTRGISDRPLRRLEHRAERLRQLIAKAEAELAASRERVQNSMSIIRPLAEIEEAIAWRRQKATGMRRCAASLTLAHDELLAAAEEVHRDFAPRLSAVVSSHLHRLTAGRYRKAILDPADFSLALEIPDRGLQPAERMSLGTREQIYLLLRIAIADTLGLQAETLPLLLDDPFVHFDAERLERMLEFLLSIAQTHQVVLFTKDRLTRDWLRQHAGGDLLTEIELPSR